MFDHKRFDPISVLRRTLPRPNGIVRSGVRNLTSWHGGRYSGGRVFYSTVLRRNSLIQDFQGGFPFFLVAPLLTWVTESLQSLQGLKVYIVGVIVIVIVMGEYLGGTQLGEQWVE